MQNQDQKKKPSKDITSGTLTGMKVLLAEDSEELQLLGLHTLQTIGGADVDLAANGAIAVEKAKSGKYDVILMDTMMPVMGGIEATIKLKEMAIKTPIVAISARSMKSEIESGLAAGCDEYLTKPFELNELISTVEKYKNKNLG